MLISLGCKSLYCHHEWLMPQDCCSDVAEELKQLLSWPGDVLYRMGAHWWYWKPCLKLLGWQVRPSICRNVCRQWGVISLR